MTLGDADDLLALVGVIEERVVALLHLHQILLGGDVAHAGPGFALGALATCWSHDQADGFGFHQPVRHRHSSALNGRVSKPSIACVDRQLAAQDRRDRVDDRHLDILAQRASLDQHRRGEFAFGQLARGRRARRGRARCRSEKLRDCGLEQLRIRSPRPGQAGQRLAARAAGAAEAAPVRRSRAWSARRRRGAELAAGDDAGGDRQHVLGGAADLDAAHVGRVIGPEASPSRAPAPARRASVSSAAASVTAVGRPRATSAAKLGPDRIAGIASGAASAITSVMNLCVPRSMPLAQAITRRAGVQDAAPAPRRPRADAAPASPAGSTSRARRRGEVAGDLDAVVEAHAGQLRIARALGFAAARRCRASRA